MAAIREILRPRNPPHAAQDIESKAITPDPQVAAQVWSEGRRRQGGQADEKHSDRPESVREAGVVVIIITTNITATTVGALHALRGRSLRL